MKITQSDSLLLLKIMVISMDSENFCSIFERGQPHAAIKPLKWKNASYFHHFLHTEKFYISTTTLLQQRDAVITTSEVHLSIKPKQSYCLHQQYLQCIYFEARQQFQQQVEENQVFGFCFLHNIRRRNTARYSGRQSESFLQQYWIFGKTKTSWPCFGLRPSL